MAEHKNIPEHGDKLRNPDELLRAQASLINEQMQTIYALKHELAKNDDDIVKIERELKTMREAGKAEADRYLRSLTSVLGMMPSLKGHQMGEFVAACWRADIAEFRIIDALKLYESAEAEAPITIDTLAVQMAKVLKEKR